MAGRENKFARLKGQNKNLARDNVITVDEQLTRLEDDIRRLKVEFDIFLSGGSKRPPYDTKNRVDSQTKRLADDRSFTFAQRYRYNTLVARFTALREVWRRTLQDREIGRGPGAARIAARAEQLAEPVGATFTCADGHQDISTIKQLYDALIDARQRNGEVETTLSFPRFHHLIATKTDNLKEKAGCHSVRFSVELEGGRVSLKMKSGADE